MSLVFAESQRGSGRYSLDDGIHIPHHRSHIRASSSGEDHESNAATSLDAGLRRAFPSAAALKRRFDQLPVHKICSDQSGLPPEAARRKLKKAVAPGRARRILRATCGGPADAGTERDCLGMTPLHVLACSAARDAALYRLLIERYPESLVAKDAWGAPPLLYALWGGAPRDVARLLVEEQRARHPSHATDWPGIVEALGRARYLPGSAGASMACIRDALDTMRASFPEQTVDWEGFVTRWAAEDTEGAKQRGAPRFHHDVFKYLVSYSVEKRLNSLSVDKWRKEVLRDIDDLRWFVCYRKKSTERVYCKLAHYEHIDRLREATSLLELSLWKSNITVSMPNDLDKGVESRRKIEEMNACRIRCGADVVVPNVLSFLLPPKDSNSA